MGLPKEVFSSKIVIFSFHLNYSPTPKVEKCKNYQNRNKIELENNIASEAKTNKMILFAQARPLTRPSVIRLADDSLATISLQSASHFSACFASTYRTDNLCPLLTLPTCPKKISLTFLRMVAPIIFQLLVTLFPLSLSSGNVPDDWHLAVITSLLNK